MYDTGTTAFMAVCTMLVFSMTPALAFFYGGLSRRKNVVNTMSMAFSALAAAGVVWVVAGWSIAYGGDGSLAVFGGLDRLFCTGVLDEAVAGAALDGAVYPGIVDVAFQMAFCAIAAAIATGSLAGRMKFSAVLAFTAAWCAIVYAPLAHMVWGGDNSLIGGVIGALDFAGGDAVHIASGVTGLVLCVLVGRRRGFGMMPYRPHNVPFVLLGTGLLWFGWFGFNAGSAFAADDVAALALLNTMVAPVGAMLSWMAVERVCASKVTLVGACTGAVTGLVAITPAAGFVDVWAALVMGAVAAPACYAAIAFLKPRLGYDDALDAFGCHGVGGAVGGLLTGVFCVPELSWTGAGGLLYTGDASLLAAQAAGIAVAAVWAGVLSLVLGLALKAAFGGLRVSAREEGEGLDARQHGESAYPSFDGLD